MAETITFASLKFSLLLTVCMQSEGHRDNKNHWQAMPLRIDKKGFFPGSLY
jgi:hypothetical protein